MNLTLHSRTSLSEQKSFIRHVEEFNRSGYPFHDLDIQGCSLRWKPMSYASKYSLKYIALCQLYLDRMGNSNYIEGAKGYEPEICGGPFRWWDKFRPLKLSSQSWNGAAYGVRLKSRLNHKEAQRSKGRSIEPSLNFHLQKIMQDQRVNAWMSMGWIRLVLYLALNVDRLLDIENTSVHHSMILMKTRTKASLKTKLTQQTTKPKLKLNQIDLRWKSKL
ncbi:hypothetical protein Lal_00008104, partial [Lupinus albus]